MLMEALEFQESWLDSVLRTQLLSNWRYKYPMGILGLVATLPLPADDVLLSHR